MSESTYTKRFHEVLPPLAGQVSVFAGTTTFAVQDLSAIGVTVINMAFADNYPASLAYAGSTTQAAVAGSTLTTGKGIVDSFVWLQADSGADFGVVFGATVGAVGGSGATANQPSLGATGLNAAGACIRLVSGNPAVRYYIHPSARYMGFVGSTGGTGCLRVYPSSRSGG